MSNSRRIFSAAIVGLFLTATAWGQATIAGKWQGTTRNGMQVVLDLKVNQEKLTGTVTREGESSPITDGKVSKNAFTFKAVLGEDNESLTGEAGDQQLKVWLDRQGPETAVVFRRAKE